MSGLCLYCYIHIHREPSVWIWTCIKNNMVTLNMNINTQPARTDDKVSLFINMNTLPFEKTSETSFFFKWTTTSASNFLANHIHFCKQKDWHDQDSLIFQFISKQKQTFLILWFRTLTFSLFLLSLIFFVSILCMHIRRGDTIAGARWLSRLRKERSLQCFDFERHRIHILSLFLSLSTSLSLSLSLSLWLSLFRTHTRT